jgi:uncharacterized protein (DUF885 family)
VLCQQFFCLRATRRISKKFMEGWAFYGEELVVQFGLYRDFAELARHRFVSAGLQDAIAVQILIGIQFLCRLRKRCGGVMK